MVSLSREQTVLPLVQLSTQSETNSISHSPLFGRILTLTRLSRSSPTITLASSDKSTLTLGYTDSNVTLQYDTTIPTLGQGSCRVSPRSLRALLTSQPWIEHGCWDLSRSLEVGVLPMRVGDGPGVEMNALGGKTIPFPPPSSSVKSSSIPSNTLLGRLRGVLGHVQNPAQDYRLELYQAEDGLRFLAGGAGRLALSRQTENLGAGQAVYERFPEAHLGLLLTFLMPRRPLEVVFTRDFLRLEAPNETLVVRLNAVGKNSVGYRGRAWSNASSFTLKTTAENLEAMLSEFRGDYLNLSVEDARLVIGGETQYKLRLQGSAGGVLAGSLRARVRRGDLAAALRDKPHAVTLMRNGDDLWCIFHGNRFEIPTHPTQGIFALSVPHISDSSRETL